MATWVIAGRSTSTMIRAATIATRRSVAATTKRISLSPSIGPNFTLRFSPFSPRSVRREMSSLLPLHTAIASASLVSKLPSEANASTEGRLASYVSPI